MIILVSDWSDEDKNRLCLQEWEIDGNDDWYREELYCSELKLDDWTCDSLIESVNKDIKDKLTVEEILDKYVKPQE